MKKQPMIPAFLRLLRQYLVAENTRSFYCLKFKDVYFTDAKEKITMPVTIGLSGAKSNQFGRGAWRTMHRSNDRCLCPVLALNHIWQVRRDLKMTNYENLCLNP
ncbi:Hypothetical protein PHPALM_11210 [Phytophthora palmivora]|uniref:Uncharacterized protein n=1 Tax=Phytophthora palmivora TaxID=4796 RepID=A0A2P4Y353_9STRA|nr:Hypothetical protein PHPALM_11210 [Phytophthora palmivora]